MKYSEVRLIPLVEDDREQFILDNQWAFKHGALYEFGERDSKGVGYGAWLAIEKVKMISRCG